MKNKTHKCGRCHKWRVTTTWVIATIAKRGIHVELCKPCADLYMDEA